jgi:hypothetical protein
VEVEEFGEYGNVGGGAGAVTTSGESWPSITDCFRAWGCLDPRGRVSDLVKGEDIRGEVGAAPY